MASPSRAAAGGRSLLRSGADAATRLAPAAVGGMMRQIVERAVEGTGPVKGAGAWGDQLLKNRDGSVDAATRDAVAITTSMAGATGFVSGLGGLLASAVTLPANLVGLAILQVRLAATIAHIHGYDIDDDRVRLAFLASLLAEKEVGVMVRAGRLPSTALGIATAPVYDPAVFGTVSDAVMAAMVSRVGGKRMFVAVARRIPVLGGVVGAGMDAAGTWYVANGVRAQLPIRRASLPRS
jgi:hypothetical protein